MVEIVDEPSFRNRLHVFDDRYHAGRLLAEKLGEYAENKDVIVFAIPAGGVEVAFEVVTRLSLPLDLVVTRKIHVPWNPEAGFGAVSWDGFLLLNEPLIVSLGLTTEEVERCVIKEKEMVRRRLEKFRGDSPFPELDGKTTIVVDDGLASGFSMLTTINSLRQGGVKKIVVAVPTAPISAIRRLESDVNKIVCLNIRRGSVFAVADAYKVWYDLEDEDVTRILERVRVNLTQRR